MKDILKLYAKVVAFVLLPLLLIASVAAYLIATYVSSQIIEFILAVVVAITLGLLTIFWVVWLINRNKMK